MGDLFLMKPMWTGAPSWAQYRAMDADLTWKWYYMKPIKEDGYWQHADGREGQLIKKCMCSHEYIGEDGNAWENSLEQKPKRENRSHSHAKLRDIIRRVDLLESEVFYPEED